MPTSLRARIPALEALRVNVIVGRARTRLSQEQLAELAGISRPTVSRIERGVADVGIEVVQRIADALSVSVSALFVPASDDRLDDGDVAARLDRGEDEFLDARVVLDAVDEAAGRPIERYSRAGRPPVDRQAPSKGG